MKMKRMKIEEIIREFVVFGKFGQQCKTSNDSLLHDTGCLVNYYTIIGLKLGGTVVLNKDKYSVTTSKNQNKIRRMCQELSVPMIEVSENDINQLASAFHDGKNEHELLDALTNNVELKCV